jgi:type III secretion protein L
MMYLIAANSAATLVTDDAVIPAREIAALRSASETLTAAASLRDAVVAERDAATAAATAAGYAAGHAAGREAAAAEARAALFDLTLRAADERGRARADVSRLALEVVRRIAGEIGDAATVAALADRAAAELLPDTVAVVRVAPEAREPTADRLQAYPGLTVLGDAALGATDCVIETPLGASHAGLDVQLAAVERAWSADAR